MEQKTPVATPMESLIAQHINLLEDLLKKFEDRTGVNNKAIGVVTGWMSLLPGGGNFSAIHELIKYTKSFIEKIKILEKANNSHHSMSWLKLLNDYAIGLFHFLPDDCWSVHKTGSGPYIMDYLKSMRKALREPTHAALNALYANLVAEKSIHSQPDGGHVPAFYCLDFILDMHKMLETNTGNNVEEILYDPQKEFYHQASVKHYLETGKVNEELKAAFDKLVDNIKPGARQIFQNSGKNISPTSRLTN
jgi:hypothetical protein